MRMDLLKKIYHAKKGKHWKLISSTGKFDKIAYGEKFKYLLPPAEI